MNKEESLNDYADRAIRYMQAVRDRDVLVDEGIKILARCEKKIQEKRSKAEKERKELIGMLNEVKDDATHCGFELEQLNERYEQLVQEHQKLKKEEQQKSDEMDKRVAVAVTEFESTREKLSETDKVFGEMIQNKISKLKADLEA